MFVSKKAYYDENKKTRPNQTPKKVIRKDGRIEQLCEHGIGHTIKIPKGIKKKDEWSWWSHGCDGCCKKVDFKKASII